MGVAAQQSGTIGWATVKTSSVAETWHKEVEESNRLWNSLIIPDIRLNRISSRAVPHAAAVTWFQTDQTDQYKPAIAPFSESNLGGQDS